MKSVTTPPLTRGRRPYAGALVSKKTWFAAVCAVGLLAIPSVRAAAQSPSCIDSSRTIDTGGPGTSACRQFDGDPNSCEASFHSTLSGDVAACFFRDGDCLGCGPSNSMLGACTNTCMPSPCSDPTRTINTGGPETGACQLLDGDPNSCNRAYHTSQTGEVASCTFQRSGPFLNCEGCGSVGFAEKRTPCLNMCSTPCEDPTRTVFVGGPEEEACRLFNGDPEGCASAWHISGDFGWAASCFFYEDDLCLGCGPEWLAEGLCTNTCGFSAACGNGLFAPPEECDDGNPFPGDGCSPACTVEPGYTCEADDFGECSTVCGDGVLLGDEECDDGNNSDGDGCSFNCVIERPQNRAQQKCIVAVNKGMVDVAKKDGRAILRCLRDGARSKLEGGVNPAEACVRNRASDPRLGKEQAKAQTKSDAKCALAVPDFGPTEFRLVPQAVAVWDCLVPAGLLGSGFFTSLDDALVRTNDPNRAQARAESRCQLAVLKQVDKCKQAQLKEFLRCKKNGLKGDKLGKLYPGADNPFNTADDLRRCLEFDLIPGAAGRLDRSCESKLTRVVSRKCAGLDVDSLFPGARSLFNADCIGGVQPETLPSCFTALTTCQVCGLASDADALESEETFDPFCDLIDNGVRDSSCLASVFPLFGCP